MDQSPTGIAPTSFAKDYDRFLATTPALSEYDRRLLKRQERDFGDSGASGSIERHEIGRCDDLPVSDLFRSLSLSYMLPARAKFNGVGIVDGGRERGFKVKLATAEAPRYEYVHLAVPNVDTWRRDFASNPWALEVAMLGVAYGDFRPGSGVNLRRKLFHELSRIAPAWCAFPEFGVWLANHTTGASSGGNGRLTIPGMTDLLIAGPEAVAAEVDDSSIRRRLLLGFNDVAPKQQPKIAQPNKAIEFFRGLHVANKPAPYEIPTHFLFEKLDQMRKSSRMAS